MVNVWRKSSLTASLTLLSYFLWANIVLGLHQEPLLTRFEFTQPQMGTLFRIVCYPRDAVADERASRDAFDRIDEMDHIMSDYSPNSELPLPSQQSRRHPT